MLLLRKKRKKNNPLSENNSTERIINKIIDYVSLNLIYKDEKKEVAIKFENLEKEAKKDKILSKDSEFKILLKEVENYEKGLEEVDIISTLIKLNLFQLDLFSKNSDE